MATNHSVTQIGEYVVVTSLNGEQIGTRGELVEIPAREVEVSPGLAFLAALRAIRIPMESAIRREGGGLVRLS